MDSFIETGTKLQKDVRLVKVLIDLIDQDDIINDDVEFPFGENGELVRKDHFGDLDKMCLPSFLLGIWHVIVIDRKNNKTGQATYDISCPENGGGTRKYEGHMGESITREIDVYTLESDADELSEDGDAEVVDELSEQAGFEHREQNKFSGTAPNL